MSDAIVAGSVAAVARREGRSVAEQFLDVTTVVIVDTSGSMDQNDSRGGRRRIDVAREELAKLQAEFPGKLAIVAFAYDATFVPGGVPPEPYGGTDLAGALRFAKQLDVAGMRFIVISDGEPDNELDAIEVAKQYVSPISTVCVGPEHEPAGRRFLQQLAQVARGEHATADRAMELADAVKPLLLAAGS